MARKPGQLRVGYTLDQWQLDHARSAGFRSKQKLERRRGTDLVKTKLAPGQLMGKVGGYSMVQHGTAWYGMVWHGMARYGTVFHFEC